MGGAWPGPRALGLRCSPGPGCGRRRDRGGAPDVLASAARGSHPPARGTSRAGRPRTMAWRARGAGRAVSPRPHPHPAPRPGTGRGLCESPPLPGRAAQTPPPGQPARHLQGAPEGSRHLERVTGRRRGLAGGSVSSSGLPREVSRREGCGCERARPCGPLARVAVSPWILALEGVRVSRKTCV